MAKKAPKIGLNRTRVSIKTGSPPATTRFLPHADARAAVFGLESGSRIIGLTKGQFSMLDLVVAILRITGPADVVISTWTTGMRDVETVRYMREIGKIEDFRFLTDRSLLARHPDYIEGMIDAFGSERIWCTRTHAKFAMIHSDEWSIVCRGSMNLNRNTRFEQFDIDTDPAIYAFYSEHVNDVCSSQQSGVLRSTSDVDASFGMSMDIGEDGDTDVEDDGDSIGSILARSENELEKLMSDEV